MAAAGAQSEGIPLSAVNPRFLHSNSTSHTWPFSAVAELIDNAYDPDVNARQLWIDKNTIKGHICLIFTDNGQGMNKDKLYKMMCFGFSDKTTLLGHAPVGLYGNGFKSGSMRLGKDAIVFTKHGETCSVGFLSQTYLQAVKAENVIVPIISYNQNKKLLTEDMNSSLQAILSHSLFNSENELLAELEAIRGRKGTRIIIWNMRETKDGKPEFDFESDKSDIRIPDNILNESTEKRKYKRQDRVDPYVPESDYSLRAYCSILYLKPRMQIILLGKKVKTQLISKSLARIENDVYKPSSEANDLGVGVIGVVECNFLKPTHNKQNFDYSTEYRLTLRALGTKLDEYWNEKMDERQCDPQNVPVEDSQERPDQVWVQCDECLKWRKLPDKIAPDMLPDEWFCDMNQDPKYRICSVPEEPEDSVEDYKKTYKKKAQKNCGKTPFQCVDNSKQPNLEKLIQNYGREARVLQREQERLQAQLQLVGGKGSPEATNETSNPQNMNKRVSVKVPLHSENKLSIPSASPMSNIHIVGQKNCGKTQFQYMNQSKQPDLQKSLSHYDREARALRRENERLQAMVQLAEKKGSLETIAEKLNVKYTTKLVVGGVSPRPKSKLLLPSASPSSHPQIVCKQTLDYDFAIPRPKKPKINDEKLLRMSLNEDAASCINFEDDIMLVEESTPRPEENVDLSKAKKADSENVDTLCFSVDQCGDNVLPRSREGKASSSQTENMDIFIMEERTASINQSFSDSISEERVQIQQPHNVFDQCSSDTKESEVKSSEQVQNQKKLLKSLMEQRDKLKANNEFLKKELENLSEKLPEIPESHVKMKRCHQWTQCDFIIGDKTAQLKDFSNVSNYEKTVQYKLALQEVERLKQQLQELENHKQECSACNMKKDDDKPAQDLNDVLQHLDMCNSERDQFKDKADQLQNENDALQLNCANLSKEVERLKQEVTEAQQNNLSDDSRCTF